MTILYEKLKTIYSIIPYSTNCKNRIELFCSILIGKKQIILKLKNQNKIKIRFETLDLVYPLIGIISFASSCKMTNENKVLISFDQKNTIEFDLNKLNLEDKNLIHVLFRALDNGANFIFSENQKEPIRDKTFRILTINNKKVIQTHDGICFYLDSIQPMNTIIETFVFQSHLMSSSDDFSGKIVFDVGAECGDTALFYANKGAKVFSFEPVIAHFNALKKNLEINKELAKQIHPTNAAIGEDGILKFYQSASAEIAGGASYVYNMHGKEVKIVDVQGFSINSAMKKVNVEHIDLLKMDCKGCEFYLTEKDLANVDSLKIEYVAIDKKHRLEDLLKILEKLNYSYLIYRPSKYFRSNKEVATIYAKKKDLL